MIHYKSRLQSKLTRIYRREYIVTAEHYVQYISSGHQTQRTYGGSTATDRKQYTRIVYKSCIHLQGADLVSIRINRAKCVVVCRQEIFIVKEIS